MKDKKQREALKKPKRPKNAEEELVLLKEAQYRTLIENLPGKVFLKDKNLVYVSCNGNYAKALKIEPEEIVGKTDYDLFPAYLAEKYRADDKRIMESGNTENIEEEYVVIGDYLENPQTMFANTVKAPVLDRSGNVTGIFGLFWDITERKKAESELEKYRNHLEQLIKEKTAEIKESEERFKAIFEYSMDGILLMDVSTKEFSMCNMAMCNMLGYDMKEMKWIKVKDIHPEGEEGMIWQRKFSLWMMNRIFWMLQRSD